MSQPKSQLTINPDVARRLAITKQRLAAHGAIGELADFLGATAIDYDARRLPTGWKHELLA